MKLILNDKEKIIDLQSSEQNEIIKMINELNGDNILSHLIIDNIEIHNDLEEYIENNIKHIQVIQVISKSTKEFINDTLLLTETYLQNGKPMVEKLAENYYQSVSDEDRTQFQDLTEGLTWLTSTLVYIDTLKERPNNWEEYAVVYHELEKGIESLAEAVEDDDDVLIADILQYEISMIYERLNNLITETIDMEGSRPDAN